MLLACLRLSATHLLRFAVMASFIFAAIVVGIQFATYTRTTIILYPSADAMTYSLQAALIPQVTVNEKEA